jgi:3-isopropylmalate/(R)-2-methylmalate dehydratase large subunit
MSERTLYDKIWESHLVARLESGQDQIFIGLHLIHEVTTPQAFASLKEHGAQVAFP